LFVVSEESEAAHCAVSQHAVYAGVQQEAGQSAQPWLIDSVSVGQGGGNRWNDTMKD
jgi:hypothetical protein